jgi:hypothetical protein
LVSGHTHCLTNDQQTVPFKTIDANNGLAGWPMHEFLEAGCPIFPYGPQAIVVNEVIK